MIVSNIFVGIVPCVLTLRWKTIVCSSSAYLLFVSLPSLGFSRCQLVIPHNTNSSNASIFLAYHHEFVYFKLPRPSPLQHNTLLPSDTNYTSAFCSPLSSVARLHTVIRLPSSSDAWTFASYAVRLRRPSCLAGLELYRA